MRQIMVVEFVGPAAEEFLIKVQQATAGWPWYMDSPGLVCRSLYRFFLASIVMLKMSHF